MSAGGATRRVVVTGLATLSPVGNTPECAWASLVSGRSGIAPIRLFDPAGLPVRIAGEVKEFDPVARLGAKRARQLDRTSQFAVVAARLALADATLTLSSAVAPLAGVALASAGGGVAAMTAYVQTFDQGGVRSIGPHLLPNMRVDSPAGHVALDLGLRGPALAAVASCATGTVNLSEAAEIIRRGDAEVMLAGGTEAIDSPLAYACFAPLRVLTPDVDDPARACKPFDARRTGFVMAEGATVLVLEAEGFARRRGARIYAELAGSGLANEAYHEAAQQADGEGAARAMRTALARAGLPPSAVAYVNAHGTGTPMNDAVETRALKRAFGDHAPALSISSTKSLTGHMMGATGAFEAMVCALAIREGIVPPTANLEVPDPACDLDYTPLTARLRPIVVALSNSMGLGGHCASVVLRRYEPAGR